MLVCSVSPERLPSAQITVPSNSRVGKPGPPPWIVIARSPVLRHHHSRQGAACLPSKSTCSKRPLHRPQSFSCNVSRCSLLICDCDDTPMRCCKMSMRTQRSAQADACDRSLDTDGALSGILSSFIITCCPARMSGGVTCHTIQLPLLTPSSQIACWNCFMYFR